MKYSYPVLAIFMLLLVSCSESLPEFPIRAVLEWQSIEKDLQTQLISTPDSSIIELPEGNFMFTRALLIDGKRNLTIKGAGMDRTILSFAAQEEGAEGLKAANCVNLRIEDLTIEDSKGDNIKVTDTRGLTLKRVKSQWTGEPKEENGAYAFYPVLSKNIVIEECLAIGASDAGVYVGQSDSVIIRNNEVYLNVAGIESENSRWVDIENNYAHHNTGGILVFDLPGLTQSGFSTRVFDNMVESNNFRNFAPAGNIVATVPPGTGVMLLATRQIEIFGNEIVDNRTVGAAIASYDLVEALATPDESQLNNNIETARRDQLYNPYPNEIYFHDNQFRNSYWFPTFKNDFGLLFMMKFPFATPDIVWDGIVPDRSAFGFCIDESSSLKFGDLDAANDFENLTKDWTPFRCEGTSVQQTLIL